MHKIKFRVWLPLIMGLVSIALMASRLRTPAWSCDAFDEERLNWHCEGSDFLLELTSGPAITFGQRVANLWPTAPWFFAYLVEFPFICACWWFIGTRLDFGILGVGQYKRRRIWLSLFIVSCALSVALLGWSLWEDFQFYRTYSYLQTNPYLAAIQNLRSLPLRVWLIVLILAFGMAALRLAQGRSSQPVRKLVSRRVIRFAGLALVVYSVCGVWAVWHHKSVAREKQAEYDLHSIMIRGRVLDDSGSPVSAIQVDLVPILSDGTIAAGKQVVYDGSDNITDEHGEYILRPWNAGRYLLAVQWNAPPSTSHPFLTRYYPDSADPKHAETLEITPARHLSLSPIRLQRVRLAKVPVIVSWSDGKPEPDAYLLFRNIQYPQFGAIGREALHADEDGTVSLPVGFDYVANAQVDCDGGAKIDTPYTPELNLSLKTMNAERKPLHFVFPGAPCRVWHPK